MNKLTETERAEILAAVNSPRFVDLPPIQIYAHLLDEGVYPIEQFKNPLKPRQSGSVSDIIGQKRRRILSMTGHRGQVVGYVRVSAADQNEARQVEALGTVDKMFSEKISGQNAHDRGQLQEMLTYVRDGDKVRVKSPDRLARSTTDLLALVEQLKAKGVALEFVDNPALNSDTPQGEFMLTVLAAIAQLERKTIRERQAEGIAIAKRDGKYEKAPKLTPEQVQIAHERIAQDVPKAKVARALGVSRQTLYAALSGSGKYAEQGGV